MSILLAGLAVFWYLGYRPADWTAGTFRGTVSRDRARTLAVVLVLAVVVTAGAGVVLGHHVAVENEVNDEVRTEFNDDGGVSDERGVTVVVQRPTDHSYPNPVNRLETALENRTERELTVFLGFVDGATSANESPQPS